MSARSGLAEEPFRFAHVEFVVGSRLKMKGIRIEPMLAFCGSNSTSHISKILGRKSHVFVSPFQRWNEAGPMCLAWLLPKQLSRRSCGACFGALKRTEFNSMVIKLMYC
jgi:hypothetical protein